MSDPPMALPEHPMASYRVCSTDASLLSAIQVLSNHSYVFLDCEGYELGDTGGKLSLLNLGVMQEEHLSIYVIDVLTLEGMQSEHLPTIFDILWSDKVLKVLYDSRMDGSELLHGHGVQLKNVLDLQVADFFSREKRGETLEKQLQRLAGFLPKHELARNENLYLCVHKLNGLAPAMREHGIENPKKRYVDHSKWLVRPMDEASLLYAAEDICKIQQLYKALVDKGYIDEDTLVNQSSAYMALHAKARPGPGRYQRHGLLPLAVFSKPLFMTRLMQCRGCKRDLPGSCFSRTADRGSTPRICFVCRAVDTNQRLVPKRKKK